MWKYQECCEVLFILFYYCVSRSVAFLQLKWFSYISGTCTHIIHYTFTITQMYVPWDWD